MNDQKIYSNNTTINIPNVNTNNQHSNYVNYNINKIE